MLRRSPSRRASGRRTRGAAGEDVEDPVRVDLPAHLRRRAAVRDVLRPPSSPLRRSSASSCSARRSRSAPRSRPGRRREPGAANRRASRRRPPGTSLAGPGRRRAGSGSRPLPSRPRRRAGRRSPGTPATSRGRSRPRTLGSRAEGPRRRAREREGRDARQRLRRYLGPARGVQAQRVAEPRDAVRLVLRQPVTNAVAEPSGHDLDVFAERFRRRARGPAAGVLERLREIPVVERDERADACGKQIVDQAVVEVESCLVDASASFGHDARPGERKAVGVQAELLHARDVQSIAVVGVARDRARVSVPDLARGGAEGVPDARAAAVGLGCALDLVRRRCSTPDEINGKKPAVRRCHGRSLTGQARLSMPNFTQSPLSPLPCGAGTASGRAREVSFSFLLRRFRGRRISNRTEGEPLVKGVILGPRRV